MHHWGYCIFVLPIAIAAGCASSPEPTSQTPPEETTTTATTREDTGISVVSATETVTEPDTPESILPPVNPLEVEGQIRIAGSSTVFPIAKAMYDRFIQEGFIGTVDLYNIGTGKGFELFCKEGSIDIANASRLMSNTERQSCQQMGREPSEIPIGIDAIAVVVSSENDFVEDVTREQLQEVFLAEKWSDVNPDWPQEAIVRYVPSASHGTFDVFVETIFNGDPEALQQAPNTEFSDNPTILIDGITSSPYAVGFAGYAYYRQNNNNLETLSIDGIQPNTSTANNGEYPLVRPLLLYVDPQLLKQQPQVRAFINFFLTHANEEVVEVGYFPLTEKVLNEVQTQFLEMPQ